MTKKEILILCEKLEEIKEKIERNFDELNREIKKLYAKE